MGMINTARTVDDLTPEELEDAYVGYKSGMRVSALAARYGVLASDLGATLARMARPRAASEGVAAMEKRAQPVAPNVGGLNQVLFDELNRLGDVDVHDAEWVRAEAERANSMVSVSMAVLSTYEIALKACEASVRLQERQVDLPKMLEG